MVKKTKTKTRSLEFCHCNLQYIYIYYFVLWMKMLQCEVADLWGHNYIICLVLFVIGRFVAYYRVWTDLGKQGDVGLSWILNFHLSGSNWSAEQIPGSFWNKGTDNVLCLILWTHNLKGEGSLKMQILAKSHKPVLVNIIVVTLVIRNMVGKHQQTCQNS